MRNVTYCTWRYRLCTECRRDRKVCETICHEREKRKEREREEECQALLQLGCCGLQEWHDVSRCQREEFKLYLLQNRFFCILVLLFIFWSAACKNVKNSGFCRMNQINRWIRFVNALPYVHNKERKREKEINLSGTGFTSAKSGLTAFL